MTGFEIIPASPRQHIVSGGRLTTSDRKGVYVSARATLATKQPKIAVLPIEQKATEDEILVGLSPLARWKFIARTNTLEFLTALLVLIASLYAFISAASAAAPTILSALSISAFAQSGVSHQTEQLSARDWIPLLLMSAFGLWSLWTISTSKVAATVAYAKDTGKIILGFIGGFFGAGGKIR